MKLRSYMRGLGIGIIVSTLLVGFAYRNVSPTMTDEEIKAAAEKLGMVEEDKTLINNSQKNDKVLSESQDVIKEAGQGQDKTVIGKDDSETKAEEDKKSEANNVANADNKAEENKTNADNKAEAENKTNADDKIGADNKANADNKTKVDNAEENKTDSEPVAAVSVSGTAVSHDVYVITIAKGSGSDTVSRLLEMGGLVKSSQEFDQYLCNNGYDSRIVEGDHSIPADASYEEIAKIITTRE